MTINRNVTGTAVTMPSGLTLGLITAMIIMLTGTVTASLMIHKEILHWEHTGYAVMLILMASSWIGASVAAQKIKRRRLMVCVASGATYYMTLLAVTGLFFGGKYSGVGETGLLILCGSTLGFLMKSPGKTRIKRRKLRGYHG